MTLRLRPHHVLCAIGFEGKGYDAPFVANMTRIVYGALRAPEGAATEILIGAGADSICAPCPHRRGLGCAEQARVDRLDADHAAALGLRTGDRLTWGECLSRVRDRVQPGDLSRLCAGCEWQPLGICAAALARLHAEADAAPVSAGPDDAPA